MSSACMLSANSRRSRPQAPSSKAIPTASAEAQASDAMASASGSDIASSRSSRSASRYPPRRRKPTAIRVSAAPATSISHTVADC